MDFLTRILMQVRKNKGRSKKWRIFSTTLAGIVVFVTTYALILPAITLENTVAEQTPGIYMDEIHLEDGLSGDSLSDMQTDPVSESTPVITGEALSDGIVSPSSEEALSSEMVVGSSETAVASSEIAFASSGTAAFSSEIASTSSEMAVVSSGSSDGENPLLPGQTETAGMDFSVGEVQTWTGRDFYAGFDRMLIHLICDESAGIPETAYLTMSEVLQENLQVYEQDFHKANAVIGSADPYWSCSGYRDIQLSIMDGEDIVVSATPILVEITFEEPVEAERLEIVCSAPGMEYPVRILPVNAGKSADGRIVNCTFRTDIVSSLGILFGKSIAPYYDVRSEVTLAPVNVEELAGQEEQEEFEELGGQVEQEEFVEGVAAEEYGQSVEREEPEEHEESAEREGLEEHEESAEREVQKEHEESVGSEIQEERGETAEGEEQVEIEESTEREEAEEHEETAEVEDQVDSEEAVEGEVQEEREELEEFTAEKGQQTDQKENKEQEGITAESEDDFTQLPEETATPTLMETAAVSPMPIPEIEHEELAMPTPGVEKEVSPAPTPEMEQEGSTSTTPKADNEDVSMIIPEVEQEESLVTSKEIEKEISPMPTPEAEQEESTMPAPEAEEEISPVPTLEADPGESQAPAPKAVEEISTILTPEVGQEETLAPSQEAEIEISPVPTPGAQIEISPVPTPEVSPEESPAPASEVQNLEKTHPEVEFLASSEYVEVKVYAGKGAFPIGTRMEVRDVVDTATIQAITDAATAESDTQREIRCIHAVDISFWNTDGVEIEPLIPIRVEMSSVQKIQNTEESSEEELPQDATPIVVHVDNEGNAETVTNAEVKQQDSAAPIVGISMEASSQTDAPETKDEVPEEDELAAGDTLVFVTDEFSVYALVYTVDFHWEIDGKVYDFSIPGGGFVSLKQLVEVLGIIDGAEELADDHDVNSDENQDDEDPQDDSSQTSQVPGALQIHETIRKFVADVAKIEISTPELLSVYRVETETTVREIKKALGINIQYSEELTEDQIREIDDTVVEAGDWALISMQPFASVEEMTVTMKNGEVLKIRLTDAQISRKYIDASGETYTITLTYDEAAQIPDGAELAVAEILPGAKKTDEGSDSSEDVSDVDVSDVDASDEEAADEYAEYIEKAKIMLKASEQIAYARLFDITIVKDGEEIQPAKPVEIRVELSEEVAAEEVKALHFGNRAELIETESSVGTDFTEVSFAAESFSVYGIVGTTIEKTVLASDGHNYRITVTYGAETGIPENADLSVEEILPGENGSASEFYAYDEYVSKAENALGMEEGSAGYIRLFDIKIVDKDDLDIKYQPAQGTSVDVRVELADKDSSEDAAASTQVVHFHNEEMDGTVIENSTDGQIVAFEADGFSIYAIVDSSKRLQYNFYDGTNLLVSEYIKKQDNILQELYDPGVEPEYGQTFIGWAYTPNETNPSNIYTIEELNRQAAGRYNSATEELTEINVYAIYDEAWYLRYMDEDAEGSTVVLNVVRVRKDVTDKNVIINYSFTPEEGIVFEGWMDVATGHTYEQGDNLTLDHHVDLYVKLQGRNWLVFDSNAGGPGSGATYTPPQLLIGNEATTTKPNDPTRRGYTFTGWNTSADGSGTWWYKPDGSVNRFGNMLSSDMTLYAQWEANDTDYYIVFWKQKATDAAGLADDAKEYDYVSSEHRTAKTGETVSITSADQQKGGTANREYGYYFTYNGNNSDVTATVDANGTTVLNVYYDRREITYNFTSSSNFTVPSYTGVVNGETVTLTPDGNGGYTYQKEGEIVNTYGWRYTDWSNRTYNLPSNYINGTFYSVRGTDGNPNSGTASAYSQNNLPPNNDTTQYYCYDTYDRRFYAIQKYITGSTISYTNEPYIGEVTTSTIQTRSASYTGLFGSNFLNWPDPGTNRVWTSTYNGRTLSLPLALTLFDPQAALDPSATQTTVNFTASNYSTGNTLTIYVQDTNGVWGYSNDYILTTANLGSNGTWYPTETFEGFTVHSYQVARTLNPNGTWTPITSSGSFSYNNSDVFLRYSRNQHNIHFISQGSHVTGRTENTVEDVYYESELKKYAEGGSDYYVPTNGKEGYYFAGWYSDPDCQIPFDFNTTMPDNDITVYAKWDTYRVRAVLVPTPDNAHNDEVELANNQALSFRLDYNEKVNDANINSSVAKRPGYKLIGWYYSPDFDPATEVHFPVLINNDTPGVDMNYQSGEDWSKYGDNDGSHDNVRGILKLYAKWELDVDESSIYVEYDIDDVYRTYDTAGMLQTTIPVDDHKYALTNNNVTFQVAEAPTEYTSGFEFYRWVLLNPDGSESDIMYNPADTASEIPSSFIYEETITDDFGNTATIKKIRLKAKFNIETEKVTTVTFDGNGGVTNDSAQQESVTESYPINKGFTMKDEESFVREGYTLIGWAFQRVDGSKISVEDYRVAIENMTADELIEAGIYQLGQEVAADNLEVSSENNWIPLENTVYAVWEINKYTVTVEKVVDGDAEGRSFSFSTTSNEDYPLAEEDANFELIDGGEKVFTDVPYGAILSFSEAPHSGYSIQKVEARQTTNPDKTPADIDLNGANGKSYTIKGETVITYTNEKAKEQKLRIQKLGSDALSGLAGATFSLTGVDVEDFENLTGLTSMDGTTVPGNLGYLPSNDSSDDTLFVLPVGSYTLSETTVPQDYIGLTEAVGLTVGGDGITVGDNAKVTVSGPDSDGVYTLTLMNIKQIDITLLKQWYAVPNTAPVQVRLLSTYDGKQGEPDLCGIYKLDETGDWSTVVEDLPAHVIVDGTVKALRYYMVEDGIITNTSNQTVMSTAELGLQESRYKAVPANGTLPDKTMNGYNSMPANAANESLSESGTLVVGNYAPHGQFTVNKTWYQLNSGYGWDNITETINDLYITGELYRIVTYTVGSETRTAEQKVATVKYSNEGVVSCESATGESISGEAEESWLLKFQETGVGNDGYPQIPTRGLWTENNVTYPAVYTYYYRETKLEESTAGDTWLDVTNRWFRAYKDNDAHTRTDLYNYRKSDLTIQKKWLPDASYGNGIQAVYFTVTNTAGENVGQLAYENPELFGLTAENVAKITLDSNDCYVLKLIPKANSWTGNEAIVIEGLTTSRPLVDDHGEISLDSWPEVQYTVTEVAFTNASGTHAISDLTRPMYQSKVRKYNDGAWRDDGTTPHAVQLGFNGDTKVRVNNTLAYDVNIFKSGDVITHALANAHFELYGSDYYESDGITVNSEAHPIQTSLISGSDGKIALGMLNKGTYYLLETQAPSGYNQLSKPVKIVVDPTNNLTKAVAEGNIVSTYPLFVTYEYYLESGNEANLSSNHEGIAIQVNEEEGRVSYSYTLTVPNTSGVALPSTGGPGTTLIYLLGLMLTGLAGTGLVMKKRRRAA